MREFHRDRPIFHTPPTFPVITSRLLRTHNIEAKYNIQQYKPIFLPFPRLPAKLIGPATVQLCWYHTFHRRETTKVIGLFWKMAIDLSHRLLKLSINFIEDDHFDPTFFFDVLYYISKREQVKSAFQDPRKYSLDICNVDQKNKRSNEWFS